MKKWISTAALLALTAVVLGALGAHALEEKLDPAQLESFKTGVRYQMWHALALLLLPALPLNKGKNQIAWLWTLGILLFSGSIYLLSTRLLHGWPVAWLGPVTPVGGLLFMAGWLLLALFAWPRKSR